MPKDKAEQTMIYVWNLKNFVYIKDLSQRTVIAGGIK